MTYRFHVSDEAVWFVVVAAGTVVLQALATLDLDKITDWRVWVVGLLVAAIRAGAGAALSYASRPPQVGLDRVASIDAAIVDLTPEERQRLAITLERHQSSLISQPPAWLPPAR